MSTILVRVNHERELFQELIQKHFELIVQTIILDMRRIILEYTRMEKRLDEHKMIYMEVKAMTQNPLLSNQGGFCCFFSFFHILPHMKQVPNTSFIKYEKRAL